MGFDGIDYTLGEQPSWERIQRTLALGGLGFWRLVRGDDDRIRLDVFDSFLRLTQIQPGEAPVELGEFLGRFYAPEAGRQIMAAIRRCFDGETPGFVAEHDFQPPNRPRLRLRIFGDVERRDARGRVLWVSGCAQNVQEQSETRERLEAALAEKETARAALAEEHRRLATILDSAALGTWEWNVQTDAVRFNQHSLDMVGLTPEEFGDRMDDWVRRAEVEDMEKARRAEAEHYAGERPFYEAEFKMRHQDGRDVWIQSRGRLVERSADGRPLKVIGVCLDVSTHKRITLALTAKQKQLELVIKAAKLGIWDLDVPSNTVNLNETYAKLLGYDQTTLENSAELRSSLMHPEDEGRAQPLVEAVLSGAEDTYEVEMRLRRRDGRYTWTYEIGRAVAWDDTGRATRLVGVHIDFSERKVYEEALLAREAAEESTKAKSEFLANMSHEIRTPMNGILGLLHLALQADGLADVHRDYLTKAEGAAKALLRIINDILDFSKIEAGKLEMEKTEFYLEDVLSQVTDLVAGRAHEKGLEFLVQVAPDTPVGLVGDPVRLTQVLSNLANNAVKFTAQGQVTIKVAAEAETAGQVRLKFGVEDTGLGLSEEQVAHLFTAFTQADASITRRYGGTGLGLAISKRLVELMHGEIGVDSQPERGSRFSFTAEFGLHSTPQRYLDGQADFSGFRALVVDDNRVALDILRDVLKSLGFTVAAAASGREALALIAEWNGRGDRFDLIIIDWMMPGMDGIETVSRLNQSEACPAKPPVIIMATAYDRDEVLGLAQEVGINNVLTKPVSSSTMLKVLMDIFGRGPSPEKLRREARPRAQALAPELAGTRILLAEDNEVNQLVASRILRNAGLVVDIAGNGRQAVDMVKNGAYKLVLMDIQMPEMDGLAATREIRTLPEFAALPIVAMTAHAMSGDREQSLAAGMNDHVNKPINIKELFSCLDRWLNDRDSAVGEN